MVTISDQQLALLRQLQYLTQESRRVDSDRKDQLEHLAEDLRSIEPKGRSTFSEDEVNSIVTALAEATVTISDVAKEHKILDSLWFQTLKARQRKVTTAYDKTFDWIFTPTSQTSVPKCSTIAFPVWLKSGTGIFWIAGKAGSGKSTLMKYLISHQATESNLLAWANGAKFATASFFFWNAGNHMQKSQEGLLQSLLYEVLRKCPELVQVVCPNRWDWADRDFAMNGTWDLVELSETMNRLAHKKSMSAKFCFFIDGLDEYDGFHADIVNILGILTQSANIKVCLSSRPWNIFEDAYGRHTERRFYLQDMTRGDIEYYATRSLESHMTFMFLSSDKVQCRELIQEIAKKSQGVFLWVFLVVRSLCEGLTDGDSILTLRARLDLVPSDLEEFFRHILESVDGIHRKSMARSFQEALRATEAPQLLGFSFLDEPDPDFALSLEVREMDQTEISSRSTSMRRRVNAWCKGLLEIPSEASLTDYWGPRVEFLHRTVRDFLETKDMQLMLAHYIDDNTFNAEVSLCRMYLAFIKTMPKEPTKDRDNVIRHQLDCIMHHARHIEMELGRSDRVFLDQLDLTLTELVCRNQCHALHHRANNYDIDSDHDFASIFEFSVVNGLSVYAAERLAERPFRTFGARRPLLGYALQSWKPFQCTESDVVAMVQLLIDHGEDPNVKHHGSVVWFAWFWDRNRTSCTYSAQLRDDNIRILDALLQRGADPNISDIVRPSRTFWQHVLETFLGSNEDFNDSERAAEYCYRVLDTLLIHGADPRATIKTHDGTPMTLSRGIGKLPPMLSARLRGRLQLADPARIRLPDSRSNLRRVSQPRPTTPTKHISSSQGSDSTAETWHTWLLGYLPKILQPSSKEKQWPD